MLQFTHERLVSFGGSARARVTGEPIAKGPVERGLLLMSFRPGSLNQPIFRA